MSTSTVDVLQDAARALGRVVQHGAGLGQDLLRSLMPAGPDGCCAFGRHGAACDVPPPCWMPRRLCDVTSTACPGAEARLLVRIVNCGPTPRRVAVQAPGNAAVTINPAAIDLGPYEREYVAVSVAVKPNPAKGEERQIVLVVRGCQDHVLRWTVKVSSFETCSCETVEVEDCPDLIHHWYDHFYCARGCTDGR